MKWKALLAVIIVLVIAGLLFATDVGQKYIDFMKKSVGNFVSIIFKKQQPGQTFRVELTTNKYPFYGQSYRITNSTFTGSGFYQKIKVGDWDVTIKSGKKVGVTINNFNGLFEYTSEGGIKLTGESNQIEIEDRAYSSERPTKIELEIVPFSFSLNNIAQDRISLQSVSGEIKTDRGQAPLEKSKLEISFFTGDLMLAEDGNAKLEGVASSIIGDKFSFT